MVPQFIGVLTAAQKMRASELACNLAINPQPDEEFNSFWQRVPISDAIDHAQLVRPPAAANASIFFSSGGSTGTPKYTLLNFSEVLMNSAKHGQGYQACGINQSDVVATWGMPSIMSSEFTVYLALAETGCCILPIGDASEPATVLKLVRDFGATVLLVMPSDLNPIIVHMEQQDQYIPLIRLVVTGGEALLQADQERFATRFSADVQFRSVFQTSDTGTIGYQCQDCGSGEFHVHDDLQLLELVNIGSNGIGELLTTNMQRQLMPVVRQRTGDLARIVNKPCPCGRSAPRIQLHGRTGRFIKFGGEKFDLGWLSLLQDKLALPSTDFRMILERDSCGCDRFRLVSDRIFVDRLLQNSAKTLFASLSLKVAAQLDTGVVGQLEFSAMDNITTLMTASGKTRFFVDQRLTDC